jgi:peptidoglycan/LPS O-acetylase OafA/YrhL
VSDVSKKLFLVIWTLGLILAHVLLFTLSQSMTATVWITLAFVWLAFLSSLTLQCLTARKSKTPDDAFLHLPALAISVIYEVLQIPVCLIFSLGAVAIPWKITFLAQAILLVVAWIAIFLSLGGNDHIKKVNSRQKNHHKEL